MRVVMVVMIALSRFDPARITLAGAIAAGIAWMAHASDCNELLSCVFFASGILAVFAGIKGMLDEVDRHKNNR